MKAPLSLSKQSSKWHWLLANCLFLFALLVPTGLKAQTTVLSENFEHSGNLPSGWTQSYSSPEWQCVSSGMGSSSTPGSAHGGSYCVGMYYDDSDCDWNELITPSMNLSSYTSATLTFYLHKQQWVSDIDDLTVYYRTSSSGSWTQLASYTSSISSWTLETLNLPNLSSAYQIKFKGNACWGYGIYIDDVTVTGTGGGGGGGGTTVCTPTLTSSTTTYYISNFTTTGATTNINNSTSGSGSSYSNFYNSYSASATPSATINFTITIGGGGSHGSAIWVDWNNDGTFSSDERVYNTTSYTYSPHSGSFTVPSTATTGDHRMRIVSDYLNSNPSDPCSASTGEFEDYKLTVTSGGGGGGETADCGTIGTGTSTSTNLIVTNWGCTYSQHIYTAAELTAMGLSAGSNITSASFYFSSTSTLTKTQSIYMGNTTLSTFASSGTSYYIAPSNLTLVYGPTSNTLSSSGWREYAFTQPFTWDGTSNIVVAFLHNASSHSSSSGWSSYATSTSSNYRSMYSYKDSSPIDINSISVSGTSRTYYRPNIKFCYEQPDCDGTYTVSATVNQSGTGTVSGAGSFAACSSVTVTANPATCYQFVNWTEGGNVVSTEASYTFTATSNRTLVANFEAAPWQPSITSNPSATTCIAQGTPVTLTAGITGGGNSLADYTFSTGTNGTSYSPSWTTMISSGTDDGASSLSNIGFTFTYDGVEYTQFSVNSNGNLRLGSTVISSSYYSTPFGSSNYNYNEPKIIGTGKDMSTGSAGYVRTGLSGSSGSYVRVIEFMLNTGSSTTGTTYVKYQVQLFQANNEVRIVYSGDYSNAPSGYQIGLGNASYNMFWYVNPSNHTASYSTTYSSTTYSVWPGANRYYSFTPPTPPTYAWSYTGTSGSASGNTYNVTPSQSTNRYTVSVSKDGCTQSAYHNVTVMEPTPTGLTFTNVTTNRATASWDAGSATSWDYSYDGGITWTNTTSNTVNLTGLTIGTTYYFQVKANNYSCTSGIASGEFNTACTERSLTWNDGGAPINLQPFGTTQISASVSLGGGAITYSSDDPSVATIDENGTVTALHPGTTTLYAFVPIDDPYCSELIPRNITVTACPDITLGSGTSTTNGLYIPSYYSNSYSLSEQLYSPCEIGKAGTISSLSFYNNSTSTTTRKFDIYLVHTDKTAFSGNADWIHPTAADKVYSGTANTTFVASDWTTIYFDTPFEYNGTQYLAVIIDNNMGSTSNSAYFRTYSADGQQAIRINGSTNYDPTSITANGTRYTTKNQVKFGVCNQRDASATFTIAATANPTGGGTIAGTGSYNLCETVTLTATPDPCYRFVRWTENGTQLSTNTALTFKATKDRDIVAVFEEWGVSLAANGQASDITVDRGSEVTLTASTSPAPPVTPTYTWTVTAGTEGAIGTNDRTYVVNPEEVTNTYTVTAEVNGCQKSATRTVTTRCPAPTNLQVTYTANGAEITWEGDADSYNVRHNALTPNYTTESVTGNAYTLTCLDPEATYTVQVQADCGIDQSAWSDVTVTPSSGGSSQGGETTVTIGNEESYDDYSPFFSYYDMSFVEQIYTAEEIGTAGTITSVSFHYAGGEPDEPTHSIVLYMKNVSRSTFSDDYYYDEPYSYNDYELVSSSNIVYSGNITIPDEEGWLTIPLSIPFQYDGTSNLMIAVDENTDEDYERLYFYYTEVPNSVLVYYSDEDNPNPTNLGAFNDEYEDFMDVVGYRADIKLAMNVTAAPSSTSPGGAIASSTDNGGGSGSGSSSTGTEEEIEIGNGTGTTYYGPYNSLWGYSFVEQVYPSDEMGGAGTITSISFNMESTGAQSNQVDIFMKNVSRTSFADGTDWESVSASDMVFSGTVNFVNGWTTITLNTPFQYDGTSNLLVGVHEYTPGYSTRYFYYTTVTGALISGHSDSSNPDPYDMASYTGTKYVQDYRINAKFTKVPSGSSGDGSSSAMDVCASQAQPIVIESVVGVSNGQYRWFRTPEEEDAVELPNSNTASYTITSDELQSLEPGIYTYTREAYNICTETWEPSEGAFTINITPAPTYPDIVVTGYEEPIVCGNEATLSVNTHRDDLTHYWYADAECTIPIGTGSNGTGVGDAITLNVYEETTIWHQIQEGRVVLFHDGFEDYESSGTPTGWTLIDNDGDGNNWYVLNNSASTSGGYNIHSGESHVTSASYNGSALTPDNWLITPQITLNDNAKLSYWVAGQDASWAAEYYSVYVATSPTVSAFTATTPLYSGTCDATMTQHIFDLSAYNGQQVYIAFRHYNISDMFRINLDDVEVYVGSDPGEESCPSDAEAITLHVSDLPTPEVQAANVTTPCGVPVTLSVGNNYDENLHYEWSFNDTEFATENIVGEGRSITISQPTNADGYNYYVRCYVIKNNNEHGCESAYATVHVTVEDAPEFTYTPETSICGDNVTVSLENTVEGYTYDWYQDNEPVNTGLNLLLENLTENTSFVINYYPTDNTQMEACYKEKEVSVTLKPIVDPVVAISGYAQDEANNTYYCGTPLTFTVTNDTADMANFDYVWFSDEACTQTLNGGSSNRELNIGNLNNLEDRTVYVKACRMNTNLFEPQSAACLSNATSASITIAPIDPVVNAYYLIDPFTFEIATKVDVCQDETIELIGSNDYSGTILGDAVDDQEIENKLVWYRTDGNGDSTMVGVTDNETALQVSESEPGTYYYYAFAVGHATQDEVSNSDITTTWNGVETDKGTALAFNVTSPNYTIYLNSLEVYPYDDNNATNVTVYYAQTANADPKDEDAGWAQVGTYQIMKNGNNAVPIVLNNSADEVDNSIVIPANSTYTIYLSADNDLYYNIHSDDNPRRASDPISGAGLLSGTAYGFGSNCNQSFPVPTCASEQSKMEFAGKLNLTLYGGNFCLSEKPAVDTVVVHEQSTTPKLEISNNQYYVCHGDAPITLTATATVTGDDISYVWMMDGETFATTTENYIEVPIPDDEEITSVEYSVVISSLTCEMTDPGSVTLNISVVPGVEDIVSDTLCAPANISQLSPSVEGEEFIEEMGWQYADSEDSEEWTTLEDVTHLTTELSGKYFRFFASTPCITGYSNAVVFVIDSVPYYDEDALKTPDPICAGAAFDWEGNNAVPNHINNSGRETRSGWNLFAGGQLTTLTADFQFEFHGIQSDYYQYNCYYVSRCGDTWDSIVSNTVTITIWDVPTIDNDIIIGNKPVCAGNPISIDAPAFTPYGEVIAHGWEYADFPGANHYTRLSDGVDIMDGDFTLGYDMNGKFVRYYVETQCGTAVSNSVQLAITAQPQLSSLTTPEAICDGTPFTLNAPEVTDNGGLDIINADWYVIIGQDDPAKVDADATITEEWNNARLFYLVENECGITSSDTITLTVNPAIGLKAYASLDGDTELEGNGCFGPDYYLVAQTNDMENVEFAWSNQMTGEVVTLERPEAGTYEYTVIATMGTGCEATATVTFTVNELMHKDTTVNVCLGELPYTFDSERQDAIFENGGDYELNYQVGAEGCDSVVTLHLNVYRPTIEHTNIHLCGGESYTWDVNGLTYGGAGIADTTLMDTVYVKGTTWISDLGNHEACDSVIQTLRVVISDGLFIDIPNDDFTVAVGEQVSAVANVRMGCQPTAAKTIMSYQLYKDGEPVDDANRYGALNFTTYLPQQNSHFSTDIAEGNGNIPGTTFNVYNYAFNYFYANFFDEIENQITATWNEPGEYEIKFVVAEMTNGQDFPMTYPTTVNGTATQIPMGGAGSTPTGLTLTDTASIVFHVDGEPVEEEETEPTANYKGHLDIDTTVFTQDINATSEFTLSIVPDAANEPTKLAVDYEIYRNDEMVATGAYGNVHFQTKVQRLNRWFGNDLTGANGSIPANTFTIVYHTYDYFYNHFAENTEHQFTAVWNQPGEYKVKFILRERTAGQDIPLPYNANGDMLIGGHGSANGAIVASDSVVFVVKGETVTLELDETICEDNLPFEYNGLTFTESTTDPVTIPDVNGLYDTLLTVNLTVITPDTVRLEETVCDSYVWNDEEFTESGVYTKNFENVHGCDSVVILTLMVIGQPEVTISAAYTTVCAGTDVPVTATLTYRAGESTSNATEVSFTSDETSRDTTAGIVTVIYESTLSELATTTQLTAQSISTANGVTCTAVDTIEITVLPTDSIVSFTATVCQGEAFDRNDEWDEVFAFGISGERTQAAIAADNRIPTEMRDTIITGQNSCGIYRAELILTVNPSFTANDPKVVEDVVCEGYDYDGNYNFNFSAEEIADMLTTATANIVIARSENESSTGCDSITELRLTVMPSARSEAYDTVCGVYYDQRQNEITESGDVDFIYPNAAASGCDSIVTVHVTVYQPVVKEVYDTVCDAFTWSDNDEEPITTSGDYTRVFTEGAANGCDSTVILHLTVKNSTHESFTEAACDSFAWNNITYYTSGTYTYEYENEAGCPSVDTLHLTINNASRVTASREIALAEIPYEWNGVTFTAPGTQEVTLTSSTNCDSVVVMTLTIEGMDNTGNEPTIAVTYNSTADTATIRVFANQADPSAKYSLNYTLTKDEEEVNDMDFDCGGRLYIGTEMGEFIYGEELNAVTGNVPQNTFHIANYHYDYFYLNFLNGRANIVTNSFTQPGTYTVTFEMVAESDGQDFPIPFDEDLTHLIGGKNSTPSTEVVATATVTFTITDDGQGGSSTSGPVLVLTQNGQNVETVNDLNTPVRMTVDANGYTTNERVAINYTILDENDEPLPMLTNIGTVNVKTSWNGQLYGQNLAEATGSIPSASFCPIINYRYNYFYLDFLTFDETYSEIAATWNVPGTYKIKLELVQMANGQDFPLTYGTNGQRMGGKIATATGVTFDTKTLTYIGSNQAANPAATGIAENNGIEGISLYPNPTRDIVNVKLSLDGNDNAELRLYDVYGKLLKTVSVSGAVTEIDLSTYASGIYLVKLVNNGEVTAVAKVMKQH